MEWLNYHHLLYFWTVAREGTIARAAQRLRLAQPTVSAQVHALEQSLGEKLFQRVGRNLVLTEMGQVVYRYADDIFSLGREMMDTVKQRASGRPTTLTVGLAQGIGKLVTYKLLEPALAKHPGLHLVCRQDSRTALLQQLSVHQLDLVVSDAPLDAHIRVKAFNHLLGESATSFFAVPELHKKLHRTFPKSLDGAPFLLPTRQSAAGRALDTWFNDHGLRPNVVAEVDDSALLKVFGQAGMGVFTAPTAIRKAVCAQYGVLELGEVKELTESYYAISVERRLRHPAVLTITQAARTQMFSS